MSSRPSAMRCGRLTMPVILVSRGRRSQRVFFERKHVAIDKKTQIINNKRMTLESALPATVRRERILELVESRGFVRVSELSERFGISEVTLRTDLASPPRPSLVQRIPGGPLPPKPPAPATPEQPFAQTALAAAHQ